MLRQRFPRAVLSAPRLAAPQRRSIHHLPPLDHFRDGIPGLFTPEGFRIAWTEYQGLMLEKLNALTAGSADDYSSSTKTLLLKYARQPSMASVFNHASMAHNNHFFFQGLATEETTMPGPLRKALESDFGSLETLRREFVATGTSMFGPGFVWLVKARDGRYSLLNTYLAGSPYPGAHWRRQARDMNTEIDARSPADYARQEALNKLPVVNSVGAHGPLSESGKLAPGGVSINPVLCVSTWQHVYMPDWGLLQKKQFLEAWWDRINWDVVANIAKETGPTKFMR
ncbi:MAG: hypothetical protein M1818_007657 [Claussenomyces sp. TS43310]|nr:MAG: hypothetical protein M1818_007657 [Claussenomyces sp. TS43310]